MSQASPRTTNAATPAFDFNSLFARNLPVPSTKWGGFAKYHFIGGNNDAEQLPLDRLLQAAATVLQREGKSLATYNLTGPQGYLPLRQFLVGKLKRDAGIACSADDILITSGSLQGLDLVNGILTEPGDTVLFEQDSYEGSINRLKRLGVTPVGIPVDRDGLRTEVVANALADLKQRSIRPKYIYTIPTVQNPTATILSEARRIELLKLSEAYGVPIFEDDCYADLVWDGKRPPALYAMSNTGNVIYIGSFSKSIAPALRVGYLLADWRVMSRILSIKADAGSGALEQLTLAEFCPAHFHDHVE
jgi:2-aminoadipate transaminase